MKGVCLDAGVLGIFFSKEISFEANELLKNIFQLKTVAFVLKPIIIESYYHLCKVKG